MGRESIGVSCRGLGALGCGLVALLLAAAAAAESGRAAGLRIGKGEGYDRVVIDLPPGAGVTQQDREGAFSLEVRAATAPPAASELSPLGIELESRGPDGFRLRTEHDASRLRVFLLDGPRLVLDLATGPGPLAMPADARRVPESPAEAPEPPERPERSELAAEPEPQPVVARSEPVPRSPEPVARTRRSAPAPALPAGPPVELKTLILVGVPGSGLDVDELMSLEIPLQDSAEGKVPHDGKAPVEALRLSELAKTRATPLPISRAALDSIAARVGDAYEARGIARPEIIVLLGSPLPGRRASSDGRVVLIVRPHSTAAALGSN